MKVFEIIKNSIFEMVFGRKDVETKITSLSLPLIKHLIKILKWKEEVYYMIKAIIYKVSYDLPLDDFDNIEDYL